MTPDRWHQLKAVYFAAMDCRSAEERLRVVGALTASDPALQREVLSLLALTEDLEGDEPKSPPITRT